MPGNAFSSIPVSKNFPGKHAPRPPRNDKAHCMGPPDPEPSTFHKTSATEKLIYNPEAAGHLLLLGNRFGMIIGGTHPTLKERTRKVLQHATVHHAMVRVEDFYKLEQLGVKCTPKCGSCRCGQCHPGGKSMTLN